MRKVISLSLPMQTAVEVKKDVKKFGYATQSEFFRDLYRQWKDQVFIPRLEEVTDKKLLKILEPKAKVALKIPKHKLHNI